MKGAGEAVAAVIGAVIFAFVVMFIGNAIDNSARHAEQYDRCMAHAKNALEQKECR